MTDEPGSAPPLGAPGPSRRQRFGALPRAVRVTAWVTVGLVLLLVVAVLAGTAVVRRPLPQTSGELSLPGLDGRVRVVRDEHGIPQLYGGSVEDLMRAQGYVQAQERFFEMDVRRHATAGRLAEMFGKDALESDEMVRTMGWRRVAAQELALLRPETRAALVAYSAGVNAYLDQHSPGEIAVEYTLLDLGGLGYRPEHWSPVDSLAWLKAMAWDLRTNLDDEINRALALADHSAADVRDLYPPYPFATHDPIVEQGAVVDGVFEQDATAGGTRNPRRPAFTAEQVAPLARLRRGLDRLPTLLGRGDGVGSNSWVVDGRHSTTGSPLLANDPHLAASLPGVWMQMGLHCTTVTPECPLDVAGFTFSGVPGVVIGHNAHIAWGFTNLGADVTDLSLEKIRGDRWRYGGAWRPLRVHTETIKVAGGKDVRLTVRATRHGPLLSDVSDQLARVGRVAPVDGRPRTDDRAFGVALQWTALQPAPTADALLSLDTATGWDSFRAAASSFAVPAQNLVYADRAGHIGYQAPGRVPIRKSGNDGLVPSAGWRPENDWTGETVPFDGLPNVLDPRAGFVVTANQAVIGPGYPYRLTDDWDLGYRSQRIRDLVQRRGRLSVADMARMQLDTRSPVAPVLVPYLLDVPLPGGYYGVGQRLLRGWDFRQGAGSGAAAYFNAVWRDVLAKTFHDDLPRELWPDGGDRWTAVMEHLLADPTATWWDDASTDGVVETRDDILGEAMIEARDEMTERLGVEPADWNWGHLHALRLRSSTLGRSSLAPVRWLFNRSGWELGGGNATVDATSWDAAEGYRVVNVPSMRMVVSLGDLDRSRWINLTGVSGHPASSHYTDQTDLWARGETLPWAFSRRAVAAAGTDTLTLTPGE